MSGDQNVVFVVRDGEVERRVVKLGARTNEDRIVPSGVASGETVVVGDLDRLADGAKVKVNP